MFERFTDRARRVLVLAEEEARAARHSAIRPEHLLVGLIHEGDGVAAKVLEQNGVGLQAVRDYVEASLAPEKLSEALAKPPFSPAAKKILEFSVREALAHGHNYMGTEHILLGLVCQADGGDPWLAEATGRDPALLRGSIEQVLESWKLGGSRSPALEAAMGRARGWAGRGLMTTGHVLVSLFDADRSMAGIALRQLGVTKEAIEMELANLDVDDTADAPRKPEPVEIRIGQNKTIRVEDPAVASALGGLSAPEIEALLHDALGRRRRRGGRRP